MKSSFSSLLAILLILLSAKPIISQNPTNQDCPGAIRICEDFYNQPNSYSGMGNYIHEIPSGGDGCPGNCMMDGEKNSVWYILTVKTEGMLGFEIIPNYQSDDYDWVVYNLTEAECEDIYYYSDSLQVSCSFSGEPGTTGPNGGDTSTCAMPADDPFNNLIPVNPNETYVINIGNWSSSQFGYTLDFSVSTTQIFDTMPPQVTMINSSELNPGDTSMEISFNELTYCNTVNPSDFILTGPDQTVYTIKEVINDNCDSEDSLEKDYTLLFSSPLHGIGLFTFEVIENAEVMDVCENPSTPHQIIFNISLTPQGTGGVMQRKLLRK